LCVDFTHAECSALKTRSRHASHPWLGKVPSFGEGYDHTRLDI
jgi:hypothetical protein